MSLLAVSFLGVHILVAVVDGYVDIGMATAVVPFTSTYERFWVGLGAVAVDLVLELVITSLLRRRLGWRLWRAVHWLAYAAYPVALLHAVGASGDLRSGPLLLVPVGSAVAVLAALAYRLPAGPARHRTALPDRPVRAARQGGHPTMW